LVHSTRAEKIVEDQHMGGPYLESGESIILTTDRVSIDTVRYQAMLTTRRIILIDSSNARFEPRVILLSLVQSVRSGKAATGEPVIILVIQEPGAATAETRNIIFLQEPLENRKPDRDLWVKTVIELSLSGRDTHPREVTKAAEDREGMRPSVRRWIAPDINRPRTENFPARDPAPEVIISPEETLPAESREPAALPEPAPGSREEEGEIAGNGYQDFLARATRLAVKPLVEPVPVIPVTTDRMAEPETVVSPQTVPPLEESALPEPEGKLSHSILAAVRSLTEGKIQETAGSGRDAVSETTQEEERQDELKSMPVRKTSPLPEDPVSLPVIQTVQEAGPAGSSEFPDREEFCPVSPPFEGRVRSTSLLPELPPESPPPEVIPPSLPPDTPAGPEPAPESVAALSPGQEPDAGDSGLPAQEVPDTEIPARELPVRESPQTEAPGPRPALIVAGGALVILLILAAALLLPGMMPPGNEPAVPPGPVPTMTPEIAPTQSTAIIPTDCTWVRISTPGYFTGVAGNPGFLQQVSGTGEKWYKVHDCTALVKVMAEKQENTGDMLLVEIYTGGNKIASQSVTAPMGSVDLLIDPATGKAPGISPVTSSVQNKTGIGKGQLEYY
jgi:hypothetical protein